MVVSLNRFRMRLIVLLSICIVGLSKEEREELWDDEDFYALLGISQEADLATIKRAYRKLSLEHHPDTATSDEGDVFHKLSRAYEVLSDQNLRRVYDQEGLEGVEEFEKRQAAGEHRMHDPLEALFGGFGSQRRETKRPSIEVPLFVSLKDLYLGKSFEASIFKQTRCKKCRGTGARTKKDIHTCPHCNGQGVVVGVHHIGRGMYQQVRQVCPHCQGKGKTISRTCNHCHGSRVVEGVDHVHIVLERGMPEGHLIFFDSMCDEVAGSTDAPGDVKFKVQNTKQTNGKGLSRNGNNLRLDVPISLKESLFGFKKEILHLDGHIVELNRSGRVTSHGFTEVLKGEGMPQFEHRSNFGDLQVVYHVEFPESLTQEQKDALETVLD